MPPPFDARAFVGRSFASVLDETGSWRWGVMPSGRIANPAYGGYSSQAEDDEEEAFTRLIVLLVTALRGGALRLLDATGRTIPLGVWLAGRWVFYPRNNSGVARLVDTGPQGHVTEYFEPVFALPETGRPTEAATPAPELQVKKLGGYDADDLIARGVEIAKSNGLKWRPAAETLFDEKNPRPTDRDRLNQWDDDRRRFAGRMRTKIRMRHDEQHPVSRIRPDNGA